MGIIIINKGLYSTACYWVCNKEDEIYILTSTCLKLHGKACKLLDTGMTLNTLINPQECLDRFGVILTFLVFLLVYGVILAYGSRFRTFQGIPGFSYMWVTLSVPLGSLLLLISSIRKGKELLNLMGSGVPDDS